MNNEQQLELLLLREGAINDLQLGLARQRIAETGHSLGRALIDTGAMSEGDLLAVLAGQIGMQYIDLGSFPVDRFAASLVPEAIARRWMAIPIAFEGTALIVAMADPANVIALDDIRAVTGRELRTVVSTKADILETLNRVMRADTAVSDMADLAAECGGDDRDELANVTEIVENAPIVKLVNMLIVQAVQDRASDIHLEPGERDIRVRYRIDGVLHEVMRTQKSVQSGLISRLKIMAEIDIAERRIPQDGRVSMSVGGKPIDLRVATLPTVWGEKVVMRILDMDQGLVELTDLGFSDDNLRRFRGSFTKPYGCILVCGPTGSGKSTTLYSALSVLNDPTKNIITVEDPVEYRMHGANQIQVNNKAGLSFASALRSILRSDPDIILIGEIRDRETAQIAIEASLTGHLVLSTIHTNDAPSAMTRLPEMGIEPFLVASAIDAVLAQRLARRLCAKCKEPYQPGEDELVEVGWEMDKEPLGEIPVLYRSVGCAACSHTGYRGRMAIHEVMVISEEIERMTVGRRSSEEIKKQAIIEGMRALKQDGLLKVRNGLTSIEEICRVVV